MPKQPPKNRMTADRFCTILSNANWRTTEQMVSILDRANYWDDEPEATLAAALAQFKANFCRRMVRSLRRDDGQKVFVNVKRTMADGDQVHVYKQEMLFDIDDYRYAVQYYKSAGMHYISEANRLAKNSARLGETMPLPFPSYAAEPPSPDVPDITAPPPGPVN